MLCHIFWSKFSNKCIVVLTFWLPKEKRAWSMHKTGPI